VQPVGSDTNQAAPADAPDLDGASIGEAMLGVLIYLKGTALRVSAVPESD